MLGERRKSLPIWTHIIVTNTTSASNATAREGPREGLNAAHTISVAPMAAANAKSSRKPGCDEGTTSDISHATSTATSVPASA